MKSGDKIPTLAGIPQEVPYAGENRCCGAKQGWCGNGAATWIWETEYAILVFCDDCKEKRTQLSRPDATWTKLDPRPK